MLRLSLVLTLTLLPMIGADVLNARQQKPLSVFESASDAVLACRIWQGFEGTFSAIHAGNRVQVGVRNCTADLDRPVIHGRSYDGREDSNELLPLSELANPVVQNFPFLTDPQHTGI
ncbi:MAG: hypothetical protein CL861_07955 [Cyanobium sp. MED843]|nr:hypothetical protein [Cyanobium sp. MED843]